MRSDNNNQPSGCHLVRITSVIRKGRKYHKENTNYNWYCNSISQQFTIMNWWMRPGEVASIHSNSCRRDARICQMDLDYLIVGNFFAKYFMTLNTFSCVHPTFHITALSGSSPASLSLSISIPLTHSPFYLLRLPTIIHQTKFYLNYIIVCAIVNGLSDKKKEK